MVTIDFRQVKLTKGLIREIQKVNETISIYNIYNRFSETGRFNALKCIKNDSSPSHVFWDSDIAKWLESVAYILNGVKDPKLKALADTAIDDICNNQLDSGYFNSYFQVYAPDKIFTQRMEHELYCAGHLIEAGIAFHECIADDRLYRAMIKYADYIYERFYEKKMFRFLLVVIQRLKWLLCDYITVRLIESILF